MVTPSNDPQFQEKLKALSKEIIDGYLLSTTHELQKKISVAVQKDTDLSTRLLIYQRKLDEYKKAHACHRKQVHKRDVGTQTISSKELRDLENESKDS